MKGDGQSWDVPTMAPYNGFREARLRGPRAKPDSHAYLLRPLVVAGKNRPWAVPGNPGGGDCAGGGRIVGIAEWPLL